MSDQTPDPHARHEHMSESVGDALDGQVLPDGPADEQATSLGARPESALSVGETAPDLLLIDLGRRGLRARRTGTDPETSLDIEQVDGASADIDALLTALTPLMQAHSGPPDRVVASVHDAARTLDMTHLHVRLAQATGAPGIVVDGLVTTLFGALEGVQPGTVVDLGATTTGFATDLIDVWQRLDGWGHVLGGRGAASWIGREGLAAGLRARDGVPGGSTGLLDYGRRAFGEETGWPALMERERAGDLLADFAPVVARASVDGDSVAQDIIRAAGEQVADTVQAGVRLVPGGSITVTGELLIIDAAKVSVASALGRRRLILVPALHDSLFGARVLGEWLHRGGTLPHRPPFVHTGGQRALPSV